MKRRLLAYMMLAMLLGTGSAVFAQSEFVQQSSTKLESIQQLVVNRTQQSIGSLKKSDIIDAILLLLAEALALGGIYVVVQSLLSYQFSYQQALTYYTPDKEKARRYSRDDVL